MMYRGRIYWFPLWLRNRLISAGLEPVYSHTEKSCIASYNRIRQFPTNIRIEGITLIPALLVQEKLSIIQCDNLLLLALILIACV